MEMGLISDNKMYCYSFVSFCSHPYFLPFPSSSFPPFYSLHFMPSAFQNCCFAGFLPQDMCDFRGIKLIDISQNLPDIAAQNDEGPSQQEMACSSL